MSNLIPIPGNDLNLVGYPLQMDGLTGYAELIASSYVSNKNATNSALAASDTWTGDWEFVGWAEGMSVALKTDVAGTLSIDYSVDGVNVDSTISSSVAAGTNEIRRLKNFRSYARVRYTNDSVPQSYLRLQTILSVANSIPTSALNSVVQQDSDSILTRPVDTFTEIKLGRFSGYSMDTKFGSNPDIDGAEDIWNGGGTYKGFPTSGSPETVTITSSAGATDAGFDVVISGLDGNYVAQTETVRLNGLGVGTSALTWWRVNRAYVDPGTSSNASNAGTLTCTHTTTTGNVFFAMPVGANQTHVCAYTVPDGYQMLVKRIYIAGARSNGTTTGDFAFRAREFGKLFRDRLLFTAGNNVSVNITYVGGLLIPPKTDVKISCTSVSATNANFTAEWGYLLLEIA